MSKYRHINGSPTTERMMTRSGRGSYQEHDDGVQIECEVIKVHRRALEIWDGSETAHPLKRGVKIPRYVTIGFSQIDGGDKDDSDFAVGQRVKIMIPNWLALKEGLI